MLPRRCEGVKFTRWGRNKIKNIVSIDLGKFLKTKCLSLYWSLSQHHPFLVNLEMVYLEIWLYSTILSLTSLNKWMYFQYVILFSTISKLWLISQIFLKPFDKINKWGYFFLFIHINSIFKMTVPHGRRLKFFCSRKGHFSKLLRFTV